ncbi:MAG: hypothetical protein NVSMB45_17510 [Ginsengibacter sp.]
MYINIDRLLSNKTERKTGYDYISLTKVITNDNMGKDNGFNENELNELKKQTTIEAVGPLISNQFRVKANAGSVIPFSTDLFLETIPQNFIDTVPADFKWQPGQEIIPIIFSADFLEMYNVFAPAQGLPQISAKTIASVNIGIECSGNGKTENFKATIVGLTDRINSILVPESFMSWANQHFNNNLAIHPERVYIKTKDANNPLLLSYADKNNFRLNKENTKFGRVKGMIQKVVSSLGFFGILVVILAMMLFSFYLRLIISKSRDNLALLVTLGYEPDWISKQMASIWTPVYLLVIIVAVAITTLLNYMFINLAVVENVGLSPFPHWSIFTTAVILLSLAVFTNYLIVKKEIKNLQ